jgi:hypothetical protein
MTLATRHLEPRRPRKDRDVTWGRLRCCAEHGVTWSLWRRDCHRAIHLRTVNAAELRGAFTPRMLWQAWRELREQVDEIDLRMMEGTA